MKPTDWLAKAQEQCSADLMRYFADTQTGQVTNCSGATLRELVANIIKRRFDPAQSDADQAFAYAQFFSVLEIRLRKLHRHFWEEYHRLLQEEMKTREGHTTRQQVQEVEGRHAGRGPVGRGGEAAGDRPGGDRA